MHAENFEIITVYYGADVDAEQANQTASRIKEQFSSQEIEVALGGQPFYAYVISAE
jgi:dihydroxyacetone kinase-like predicted kinase